MNYPQLVDLAEYARLGVLSAFQIHEIPNEADINNQQYQSSALSLEANLAEDLGRHARDMTYFTQIRQA